MLGERLQIEVEEGNRNDARAVLFPISCVALNFLTAAALPFSLAYFPMRARSSGVNDVVYLRLLARLPPFPFDCKAALTAWFTS